MYSTIKAKVVDQTLTITSVGKLASGGENEVCVEVVFDSYWSGYGKTAIFYRKENQVYHVVMQNDVCVIPREVMTEPGKLYFGIIGASGSSVRTTEVVALKVEQGAITGLGNLEPLPDVYKQVLSAYASAEASIAKETSARKQEVAVERARIDNLVAGGTVDDAELLDVRVGAHGETYGSAGDAVRGQIDRSEMALQGLIEGIIDPCGRQILDIGSMTHGISIDIYTGATVDSTEEYYAIDRLMPIDRTKDHHLVYDKATRTYLYFYDAAGTYISYVYTEDDCTLEPFPENTAWVKIVFLRNSDTDVVPSRDIKLLEGRLKARSSLILGDASVAPRHCTFFIRDLLKQDEVEYQMVFNPANGVPYAETGLDRSITGLIDVTGLKYYTTNFKFFVAYYDETETFISDLAVTSSLDAGTYAVPEHENLKYMRMVLLTTDSVVIGGYHISSTEYPYEREGVLAPERLPEYVAFNWYKGKKVTVFGDSITEGNKWQPYVTDKLGCTTVNCGIGGTTVANNGGLVTVGGAEINGWMSSDDRINLIPDDSDMIVLFGGANDWAQSGIGLGELGDGNLIDTTFKSAYSLMIRKIANKFPNARLIALTPINGRTSAADSNEDMQHQVRGLCLADFSAAVKEVCHYYGVPCIDVHGESGINTFNHTTYIADIVHPNDEGGKRIANAVINGLKRFEPVDFD